MTKQHPHPKGRARTLLCSFFLPCLLLGTVFAAMGVFPFGEKSLLIIDMNSEYVDYLAQMNETLRTGGSFLRSWNMGMGLNMLGLIAFYTSSPFNLLVMLFPVGVITEVLLLITLLKVGLAGLAFALYTDYAIGRRGLFAVLFAAAYALCSYNIAYASNIMWLDGVAFLPLVLLGVEKILREGRYRLFLWSLVYVFFCNYYIGYMVGGFAFLYFTALCISQARPLREYGRMLLRFVGTAAVAAGCCAFLLLPAFLNLRSGQAGGMWDIPLSLELERSFVQITARLLPGVYDTLTDAGYPNIYSSILAVLLCTLYFTHKQIPRREKLVFGGLLGFLLLSMSCKFLYLAWHAFENPTWFPARFSFVFCFLVLYLAMRMAVQIKDLSGAGMAGGITVLAILLLQIGVERFRYVTMRNLLAGGALVLLYALLWGLSRKGGRPWVAIAAFLLVCTELWGNAYVMERGLDNQFQYKTRASYNAYHEQYAPAVAQVKDSDKRVYRMEITEQRNANGGMALGYNGISHYSTTTDQPLNQLLRRLGYNKGTTNELRFAPNTPLTNGLLGIRYVLSSQDMGGGYEHVGQVGDVGIYENSCAFPLLFRAPADALAWRDHSADPFALQNSLLRAALGTEELFVPVDKVEESLHNLDREEKDGHLAYSKRVNSETGWVDFAVHNSAGQEAYAFLPVWKNKFSQAEVYIDGQPVQKDLAYRKNTVISLGGGEETVLSLELHDSPARIAQQYFYTLDLQAAQQAAEQAWEQAVEITQFTDTAVKGNLLAGQAGAVVTTFPYDAGWKVKIDGKPVQTQAFAEVFLAFPVPEGEHMLEMRYLAPGFVPGCVISAGCFLGLAIVWYRRKRVEKIKKYWDSLLVATTQKDAESTE